VLDATRALIGGRERTLLHMPQKFFARNFFVCYQSAIDGSTIAA
jgi:hypothetical protein